jgi:RNA polymerase sigma-70 factor, ECF subfamily
LSDEELIDRILKGDKQSFRIIVEKYQKMVFSAIMGFLHNKDDADDLTQEVFIQAYLSLNRFRGQSAFSTWLYRITINASLNKIRKSKRFNFSERLIRLFGQEKSEDINIQIPDSETPENLLIKGEFRAIVNRALDSLPGNQRTVMILSKYDDLSQKEIASIMKTTEGAVEALLQRAKANLRKKLSVLNNKNKK